MAVSETVGGGLTGMRPIERHSPSIQGAVAMELSQAQATRTCVRGAKCLAPGDDIPRGRVMHLACAIDAHCGQDDRQT